MSKSTHRDYLAAHTAKPEDAVQYGIPGMKWGVRRSRETLQKLKGGKKEGSPGPNGGTMQKVLVNKKTGSTHEINPDGSVGKRVDTAPKKGNIQDNVESSSARYARLAAEAKAGRASQMTEQDLKFFNARTEALNKINKMYETQPGWLKSTTKEVLQNTAKRSMQQISNSISDKYVNEPLLNSLKNASKPAKADDDD